MFLWIHIKKYHKPPIAKSQPKVSVMTGESQQQVKTVLDCKYCNNKTRN